jgi:hypothetical protein
MALTAFWGLTYGWWHWRAGFVMATLSFWRRTIATVGLLLITLQALVFAVLWAEFASNHLPLAHQAYRLTPLFLVAVPCVFGGKGPSRWWLLSSSILLFVISFSIMLND